MKQPVFYSVLLSLAIAGNVAAQQPFTVTADMRGRAQTIHNFGASGCWFSESIGRYWPQEKKEKIAELLFSRELDAQGNPKGIGLSAWRFNIGGGTEEQGDSSGIKMPQKRVESFLDAKGNYNWNKQSGYQWFLKKAKAYGVETLIAFSNTPPVQFNTNGLGFKTVKDYKANLKPEYYTAYADFLAEVLQHFDKEDLHFDYISPVNEPQWDWSNKFGSASQEGSPWSNEEIYHVVTELNSSLQKRSLSSRIMITEAGMLTYLYGGNGAGKQIQYFFNDRSPLNVKQLSHVPGFIGGHSYFTDNGDSAMIAVRRHVADTARQYGVEYWQTEYSMLGDGFREGSNNKRTAMDCALFLAKLIHQDIAIGNAAAWQLWNSYEPGKADEDTRYYLVALHPDADFKNGSFTPVKNLWALGHYSRFIRPGMHRVPLSRSDNASDLQAAQGIMLSAYADNTNKKLVLVAVNYTQQEQTFTLNLQHFGKVRTYTSYTTTASPDENMKARQALPLKNGIRLPSRSITTILINR